MIKKMWAHCYMIVDLYKYNVSFYYFRKLLKFFIPRISSENKKDSKTRCLIFRKPMMNKSTNNLNTYVLSSNPPKIIINDAPQVNNLLVSNNYNSLMLFKVHVYTHKPSLLVFIYILRSPVPKEKIKYYLFRANHAEKHSSPTSVCKSYSLIYLDTF